VELYPESSTTATNSIYVWGAQVEESNFPTSYIKTTVATVTRTPDELCYDNTNNQLLPNSFSLVMSTTPAADGEDYETNKFRLFSSIDSGGDSDEIRTAAGALYEYSSSTGGGFFRVLDTDIDIDTQSKYGFQLFQDGSDVDGKIFLNGVKKKENTKPQTLAHSDIAFCLGWWRDVDYYTGNIKDVSIFRQKLSDAEMIRRTT